VGSITHKRQNCIVAVGATSAFAGIGVDLEVDAPDSSEDDIRRRLCATAAEVEQARALSDVVASPGTLFLSAKEAVFKLEFPLTGEWLDFDDVEVTFAAATFEARRTAGPGVSAVHGVFGLAQGWIGTIVTR
jgi:4'-phosphopantetheinyl transferase EntD